MAKYHTLVDEDSRIIVIERGSQHLPWAVATIVVLISVGFGIIVSMHHSTLNRVAITEALMEMHRNDSQKLAMSKSLPEGEPSNVKVELPELDELNETPVLEEFDSGKAESGDNQGPMIEEFQD